MNQIQDIEGSSFSTDTDGDLLGYMAMREEDEELATQAWGEFYRRHVRYMFGTLKKRLFFNQQGFERDLEDLIQDTFQRAYERATTFKDQGVSDPEELRKRARGWLGTIAQNLYRDRLRGENTISEFFYAAPEKEPPSGLANLVGEALNEALDEREREVLRVTAEYLKPGENSQRMPNGVAKKLAADLNTTTANVRMIRKRAIPKVRRYVQEHQAQWEQP